MKYINYLMHFKGEPATCVPWLLVGGFHPVQHDPRWPVLNSGEILKKAR